MDIDNELSQFEGAYTVWKTNNGWQYVQEAMDATVDKLMNVGKYYDDTRKYSIIRNATEGLKLDTSWLYNEKDDNILALFNEMTSEDVLTAIKNKFLDFQNLWKNTFGDNYSFHAGDGIKDRLEEHKRQENVYGYPFQSAFMTTIFRGMRKKKFFIRSAPSGCCKSRNSMAEAANIASSKIYDWNTHSWVATGESQPVLFISTELSKEEIQDCLLAHISGVEEDRIAEWRDITSEEESVINEAATVVEESLLYGEYLPDFTIDTINSTIEKYVINQHIEYAFFDYINDSPELYRYYYEQTKTRLRTDQILFLFSCSLKRTANKYDIYLGSSTQLNDNYKDENNKDGSALKGSKAIIEKADYGVLALPVTFKDLKSLDPILKSDGSFAALVPNMSYYIFKNRGGKWKAIIVWTKINLGTMREIDCFVTDYNYNLVTDLEKTIIDFELSDVGDVGIIDSDDTLITNKEQLLNELSKSK